jgi:hypothetical protein
LLYITPLFGARFEARVGEREEKRNEQNMNRKKEEGGGFNTRIEKKRIANPHVWGLPALRTPRNGGGAGSSPNPADLEREKA